MGRDEFDELHAKCTTLQLFGQTYIHLHADPRSLVSGISPSDSHHAQLSKLHDYESFLHEACKKKIHKWGQEARTSRFGYDSRRSTSSPILQGMKHVIRKYVSGLILHYETRCFIKVLKYFQVANPRPPSRVC